MYESEIETPSVDDEVRLNLIDSLTKRRAVLAKRSERGFTLIELLIVIVILGILAAIVVFAVGGVTDKGQTSACSADANTLRTAEEAYFAAQKPVGSYVSQGTTKVAGDLVSSGFLANPPTYHTAAASGGTYSITAVSPCTS